MASAASFRLETDRLILREWEEGECLDWLMATNTEPVMRWLGGIQSAESLAGSVARLEQVRRDHGHTFWAMERKDDGEHLSGEVIGFCGLKRTDLDPDNSGDMEIGWRLCENAWGMGYAREAAQACMDAAFTRFAAPFVVALTVMENTASWGLMERLGMQRREDLDFTVPEGKRFAGDKIILYAITRKQWEANQ
ncbi:GNAT family N-acetyltransferase [Croceicoccus mobilis]|uniref:N-acetyltransferase n=1 Tax=Croceicoccus mobilis TaxID=1703339 RepID=A0A916YTQ7_9SPHN|nr:GNAT family N-acetyltransferase [Croceicoccus mobilis]GGD60092.1 N-acetyltransferase [Croceicoccus mobilis]